MTECKVTFGLIIFDAERGKLRRDGMALPLSQRAIDLLRSLLDAKGQAVSKNDLMAKAWPGMIVEEGNLTVQIAALRKVLGRDHNGNDWIVTVPRVGYRLLIPEAKTKIAPEESIWPLLAVLPFKNLSGDPEQDYFADGVVEDIITALSRFKSFAVIARNSSFTYKGRATDVRQVASELGVRYVLEGSVRRAGTRLRISAELVDSLSGSTLWSQHFDGDHAEVFDFQDRITESVAMIVEPQIRQAEIARSRRERPGSIAAYDLCLRAGANFWTDLEKDDSESYALLMQALALDPNNAACLAQSALSLMRRNIIGWSPISADDRTLCTGFVRKALLNAGQDATVMAFCGDALVHFIKDYDWAMATIQQAIERNPNNLVVVYIAGIVNLHCGDIDDALAHFHRALRLSTRDPNAHMSQTAIAHAAMIRGEWNEAILWASRALALKPSYRPTYWMLVAANAQLGRIDQAKAYLEEYRRLSPRATVASIWAGQPQKTTDRCASILEGLRLAGLPEG